MDSGSAGYLGQFWPGVCRQSSRTKDPATESARQSRAFSLVKRSYRQKKKAFSSRTANIHEYWGCRKTGGAQSTRSRWARASDEPGVVWQRHPKPELPRNGKRIPNRYFPRDRGNQDLTRLHRIQDERDHFPNQFVHQCLFRFQHYDRCQNRQTSVRGSELSGSLLQLQGGHP